MKYALLILILSFTAYGKMRVMTYNTTCSICNKGKFDKFRKRKKWILDTIKRANPDVISLQEILLPHQLRYFKKRLPEYKVISYRRFFFLRYPDPALLIRKDRFRVTSYGGFWLGPKGGKFSLGWKTGFPRRVMHTKIYDLQEHKEFLIVGTHFDNSDHNKHKSAAQLVKRYEDTEIPIIFAADTNLKYNMEGYQTLKTMFDDTYDFASEIKFIKNSNTNKDDSCNLEKGKTFPECRVDHVMVSNKDSWDIFDWSIDQYKYGKKNKFNSDHRALYVDLELK